MKKLKNIIALVLSVVLFCGCADKASVNYISVDNEEAEKRVSFFGVGDNLIHNCVYWQADANADGSDYDFKPMYSMMADYIKDADISYINQETILGGSELGISSYPLFNSPQELGRDMIELGFDVFSHATNHTFDKGEKGIENTYEFYKNYPDVTCIGIYKKGEENIKILQKNGIKIAFVNYTYHTNGLSLQKNSEFYVPIADYNNNCEEMLAVIKKAKENADFVVCCVHWGDENSIYPNDIQKNSAKLLADAGCDIIIGTHSHTIQPVEIIGDTLCVYSLGNFISAQNKPQNLVGGTISFDMVKTSTEKKIENISFKTVVNQFEKGYSNIRIIPFESYTTELAESHGVNISYDYIKNLIDSIVPKEIPDIKIY